MEDALDCKYFHSVVRNEWVLRQSTTDKYKKTKIESCPPEVTPEH